MIKLYTIGFTGKSAQKFFDLLEQNHVRQIIDTRISNNSQLSGYAKGPDLAFFARRVAAIDYVHNTDLAPTKELLDSYRNKRVSWDQYTVAYLNLLRERDIQSRIDVATLNDGCLLCSEHQPHQCHRRLLAEYLRQYHPEIEIIHLV